MLTIGFSDEESNDQEQIMIAVSSNIDHLEAMNGGTMRITSFKKRGLDNVVDNIESEDPNNLNEERIGFKEKKAKAVIVEKLQTTVSFKNLIVNYKTLDFNQFVLAATKLQKAYRSYRTRRSLADCAVVVEELWWKTTSVDTDDGRNLASYHDRSETAVSRWARAKTMAAMLGKGLSKDEKAQKLALRHWLEAIDPRHRYGHNLHLYYNVWFDSESAQPFFFWLDVGDGKEVNLDTCSRIDLQRQCIQYLGPKERETYEVVVKDGKLTYKQTWEPVHTIEGTKWIFVLGASRKLYIGQKKKGLFQHSSFLAGGAAISAGRLIAHYGVLEAVWSYSGHYRPTEENFMEFITFLEEQHVDLTNVKRCAMDDDIPPSKSKNDEVIMVETTSANSKKKKEENIKVVKEEPLPCKWTTGAGPRIGCVREYPTELQVEALKQVNLSPRLIRGSFTATCRLPIPSPRPSPNIHLSPRLQCVGLTSPRLHNST